MGGDTMSIKIKVNEKSYSYFYFQKEGEKHSIRGNTSKYQCNHCGLGIACGIYIDKTYKEIIDNLKKANLLPANFKYICCICFEERRLKCL